MTVLTENFNKADSDILGPNLSWTEISGDWDVVSNECHKVANVTSTEYCRAESDLASSNNYCQAKLTQAANVFSGPCCRFSSSANTFYATYTRSSDMMITKFIAGVQTDLASGGAGYTQNSTVKVEANGSTIKAYKDAVEQVSVTDTSIATGLRGGLMSYNLGQFDDWEAGDIAPPLEIPHVVMAPMRPAGW